MSKTIDASELGNEIAQILEQYKGATYDAVERATDIVGQETANQVRMNAEKSFKGKGKYAKAWTYKGKEEKTSSRYIGIVKCEAPHYRLTHLLEYGHLLRNGKRYQGKQHIKPAEEYAEKRLMELIPTLIERNSK